jgi:general secretion pathway protein C
MRQTRVVHGQRRSFLVVLFAGAVALAPLASGAGDKPVRATKAKAPCPQAQSETQQWSIRKTGPRAYAMPRAELEVMLGGPGSMSRSARIVPEQRDGKLSGFRLYSIRPEGPFAKLGLQNGDLLVSVNGLPIMTPERALEIYARLKNADHIALAIERDGQPITLEYTIR